MSETHFTSIKIGRETPGSQSLASVILEKIDQATVVIADVTLVGAVTASATDGVKKLINSNVAIELGYALKAATDKGVLMIMNCQYGTIEELPFDLRHRGGIITFNLAAGADSGTIKQEASNLRSRLVGELRKCIAARVTEERERARRATPFTEAGQGGTPAVYFSLGEDLAKGGDWTDATTYRFDVGRQVYVRLFPRYAIPKVGLAKLGEVFRRRDPCAMSETIGGVPLRNHYGWITIDPVGSSTTIAALTQGFETGELWGVNGRMFVGNTERELVSREEREIITIPMIAYERICVRALKNYLEVAKRLDLPLPYVVELGAFGLNDVYLGVPDGRGSGRRVGPVMRQATQARHELANGTEQEALEVLRAYFNDFYDLASVSRTDFITEALRAANDLPPL